MNVTEISLKTKIQFFLWKLFHPIAWRNFKKQAMKDRAQTIWYCSSTGPFYWKNEQEEYTAFSDPEDYHFRPIQSHGIVGYLKLDP